MSGGAALRSLPELEPGLEPEGDHAEPPRAEERVIGIEQRLERAHEAILEARRMLGAGQLPTYGTQAELGAVAALCGIADSLFVLATLAAEARR